MNTITLDCVVNTPYYPINIRFKLQTLDNGQQKLEALAIDDDGKTIGKNSKDMDGSKDHDLKLVFNYEDVGTNTLTARELHRLSPSYQKAVDAEMKYHGRSLSEAMSTVDSWTIW